MVEEVTARGLGRLHALDGCIGVDVELAGGENVLDILGSLADVALDIHGETRRFWDSESEIEGDAAGNAAQADEDTPAVVDVLEIVKVIVDDIVFKCGDDDERGESSSYEFRASGWS